MPSVKGEEEEEVKEVGKEVQEEVHKKGEKVQKKREKVEEKVEEEEDKVKEEDNSVPAVKGYFRGQEEKFGKRMFQNSFVRNNSP